MQRRLQLDILFGFLTLGMPLAFAMRIKKKLLAVFAGTIWVWGVMIVAGQYNLITDPEYDSMAPAISMVAGWVPGVIYASLCVLVVFVCSHALVYFKTQKNGEPSTARAYWK